MLDRSTLAFAGAAALAVLAVAWLYHRDAPLRIGLAVDAYHHMAAVRELARGEFPPRHDLVVQPGLPQGHYGPYLVALATLGRWTGAAPLTLLYIAGCLNLVAYLVVFRAWVQRCGAPEVGALAALVPILLWGPWPARVLSWPTLRWPGTTSLADAQNFFYPQQAGLVLLLAIVWLLLPIEETTARPAWRRAALALLLTAALITTHPLTALALGVVLAASAACEAARRAPAARIALLLGTPVAALGLAALWPYYPVLRLLAVSALPGFREPLRAAAVTGAGATETPAALSFPLLSLLGPAVVGLIVCISRAWRRQPLLLAWFLALELASLCPVLPLRHRFVFFAVLPVQIAATVFLDGAWRRGAWGRVLVVVLLGAGAASAVGRIAWTLRQETAALAFVARATPPDAVILADQDTANGIAGLAGRKVVVPQHPDLFLVASGGWQRVLDVRRFLAAATPPEERDAILRRWQTTHVLLDRLATQGLPDLPYPVIHEEGGYVLYDVRSRSGIPR